MIVASLQHADLSVLPPSIPGAALEFLRRADIQSLPDGKYEIDGGRVFAMVQRYATQAAPEPRFECHRKFIDIQYIVSGAEVIGWAPLELMSEVEAYDAEKDISFGVVAAADRTPVLLRAGQLAVFYPQDCHAPKLPAGVPGRVMKIVVKVMV